MNKVIFLLLALTDRGQGEDGDVLGVVEAVDERRIETLCPSIIALSWLIEADVNGDLQYYMHIK